MKVCPKCGKEFGDIDNYCIFDGAELRPKALVTVPKKHVDSLSKRLGALEKKITQSPPSAHDREINRIKTRMINLEQKVGSTESALKRSVKDVENKADRMSSLAALEPGQAKSLVDEIGRMQQTIHELNQSLEGFRSEMPRTEHILEEIEHRIAQTKGVALTQDKHETSELKRRIELMESRLQGAEQDMEEEIEKLKREGRSAEFSKFMTAVEDNRKRISELYPLKQEVESIKSNAASFDAQEMKNGVMAEIGKLESKLSETVAKKGEDIQRLEQEMARMRQAIDSIREVGEQVKGVDSKSMSRDLEILKTKSKWLEEQVEGLDLKPLHSRLKDLEHEMRKITVRSPLIVE